VSAPAITDTAARADLSGATGRPGLTAKGEATRARIVAAAAELIREDGVAATTLDDIRARTSTSKSQVFHYFPGGKEELLLAVAQHEADLVLADQQPHLGRLTSWPQWSAWRDAVVARYRAQGPRCPLGVLVTEIGRGTPATRALTGRLIEQWQAHLAAGIRAMQAAGEIDAGLDADRHAAALVAGIQGGVTILMATGDLGHLEAALDTAIERLRASVNE
jgi:AcrR family transcriptional regulator